MSRGAALLNTSVSQPSGLRLLQVVIVVIVMVIVMVMVMVSAWMCAGTCERATLSREQTLNVVASFFRPMFNEIQETTSGRDEFWIEENELIKQLDECFFFGGPALRVLQERRGDGRVHSESLSLSLRTMSGPRSTSS